MRTGFKPNAGTDKLALGTDKLDKMELPDWVHVRYALHQVWNLER